jgi:hypothetical protein
LQTNGRCIAFREAWIDKSVVFIPCGQKIKDNGYKNSKARFCRTHERAYREILLGILNDKPKEQA